MGSQFSELPVEGAGDVRLREAKGAARPCLVFGGARLRYGLSASPTPTQAFAASGTAKNQQEELDRPEEEARRKDAGELKVIRNPR